MKKSRKLLLLVSAAALSLSLTACSNGNHSSQTSRSETSSKQVSSRNSAKTNRSQHAASQTSHVNTSQIKLSQDDALNIFNQKFHNSKIKSIELEEKAGQYVYEIDGFDTAKEHSMTINAKTGKVMHQYSEHLDADDHHEQGLDLTKVISRKKASQIAKQKTGATPIAWTLEEDDGRTIWEVKTVKGSDHGEVKIDAHSQKGISEDHDVDLDD